MTTTRDNNQTQATSINRGKENVIAYKVNDTCKRIINSMLNLNKKEAIRELTKCTYKTDPPIVASYLKVLFKDTNMKDSYILWVCQAYTPRVLNRVITKMNKQHKRGEVSIRSAAKYFSYLLKYRKKRKNFRKQK